MRWQRSTLALAVAGALVLPPAVMAQQSPARSESGRPAAKDGELAQSDRKFMMETAQGNLAEVELGKLASEKASSDGVKDFGKRMADDHGKATTELKELASKKGVTLPTDLDQKHRQLRDRLARLSGAEFDRAYVDEMVKDHKKDVSTFKREANRAKDADVKAWAGKTLPTLEEHLKQVQQLQAQVKGAGSRAAR